VHQITPLTGPEQELVTSWSAPDSWQPGARHPGRGKYLIETGERLGILVELSLGVPERELYDTDHAIAPGITKGSDDQDGRPRVPVTMGSAAGMWCFLALCWGLFALTGLVWVAAYAAAAVSGGHVPPFGEQWATDLARGRTSRACPGTPTALVAAVAAALAGSIIAIVATAWRVIASRRAGHGDPVAP